MTETVQPFEADVSRVLDLVINSLYKEREIFLRELISNASDACDKLRYQSLSQPELLGDDPELKIRILADEAEGLLTVSDNGIGMSREDLVENLGTIARSGTGRFLEQLSGEQDHDLKLIGQFGVGFYSVFMVADRVVVQSRRAGEEQGWLWASDGRSGYTVQEAAGRLPRGTSVTLHMKADAKEFLDSLEDPPDRADLLRPYRHPDHPRAPAQGRRHQDQPRRAAADQRGQRDLDPAQGRDHRGAVQGVLPPRRARLRRAVRARAFHGRGHALLHGATVRSGHAAVRPARPEASAWGEALRPAGVHHRRPRDADAALPALRQRRGRLRGPAAQRQPRDAAARRRDRQDAQGAGPPPAGRAGRQGQARAAEGEARPSRRPRATTTGGASSARC